MKTLRASLDRAVEDIHRWFLDAKRAECGIAAARILVGISLLGIMVTNFGVRHALWGPASTWIEPLRVEDTFGRLHLIFAGSDPTWFTVRYLILMAIAVAVILGWRTRLMTLLLIVGIGALTERNGLVGDQGDNIARIGMIFMLFMNTAERWSLDARRRRRVLAAGPVSTAQRLLAGLPVLPPWLTNPIHNAALLAIALQLFILYTASALYKVQGGLWQEGTALYYPLSLHEYAVFPWLNQLLTTNAVMVTLATYFAVFVQLFFAVGLLHPLTRRLALLGVIAMHIGIAVLMGLPWFSLSMIAFDAIFVSTATFVALDALLRRRLAPVADRFRERLPLRRAATAASPAR